MVFLKGAPMRFKMAISLFLAVLAFIFIFQNIETVEVKFLVWSVPMSRALLVVIMLGIGMILGWLISSYIRYVSHRGQTTSLKTED
jgi:uncharacterized integral membrane protein